MTGFRIMIQSERDAMYLEERIDSFLQGFDNYLSELSEEKFEQERTSLVNRLKEDFKNLYQETGTYWAHIHSGYYDFERHAKDAAHISKLSKQDIIDYFRKKISPDSSTRAKLSVHLQSQHLSKTTVEAVPEMLSKAGIEFSDDIKALIESTPSPLIEDVLAKVENKDVNAAIKELHQPSKLGSGKQLFEDAKDVKGKMLLGPPSSPIAE